MYCSTCGTPAATGLSFCNRCGNNLDKERGEKKEVAVSGYLLSGVVLVALLGLGIIFGGSIALKKGGDFSNDLVGLFMVLSFAIVGLVELILTRQLSRVLGAGNKQERLNQGTAQPLFQPAQVSVNEMRATQLRGLAEPIPSVTENTTRTLENLRGQSLK